MSGRSFRLAFNRGFRKGGWKLRHAVIALVPKLRMCWVAAGFGEIRSTVVKPSDAFERLAGLELGYLDMLGKACTTAVLVVVDGRHVDDIFGEGFNFSH
jgi:hypothetical protein